MSKIGKTPVIINEGTTITKQGSLVTVVGTKGTLTYTVPQGIEITISEGVLVVSKTNASDPTTNALFGLVRALIANMVKGVSTGFEKKLELTGVGYRAQTSGAELTLSVGFSHTVKIPAPQGIQFKVADNGIVVSGIDKALVGDVAAKIRAVRPPEPYKGKGIKYAGERIRRKAGKAAKAVGGK